MVKHTPLRRASSRGMLRGMVQAFHAFERKDFGAAAARLAGIYDRDRLFRRWPRDEVTTLAAWCLLAESGERGPEPGAFSSLWVERPGVQGILEHYCRQRSKGPIGAAVAAAMLRSATERGRDAMALTIDQSGVPEGLTEFDMLLCGALRRREAGGWPELFERGRQAAEELMKDSPMTVDRRVSAPHTTFEPLRPNENTR